MIGQVEQKRSSQALGSQIRCPRWLWRARIRIRPRFAARRIMKTCCAPLMGMWFLLVALTQSLAQFDPEKWPRVNVRFSEQGTLKDVFDSGLRPYHFPSLERTTLAAKHVRVTVVCRNGELLPELPAEFIKISPREGGVLSSMELTRCKTTLEEARGLMLPYLPKGNRTIHGLDRFLDAVKADYLDYNGMGRDMEDFAVQWSDAGGPRYIVAFRKAVDPIRPLIFYMTIDWSQTRTPKERRSFYKEPIPPPPGYEGVSMEAPEKFGPDSGTNILLSHGTPIAGDRPPTQVPQGFKAPAPAAPLSASIPAVSPPAPSGIEKRAVVNRKSGAWLWLIGVSTVTLIAALIWKRRAQPTAEGGLR